jgi:hypothetical protein
VSLSYTVETMSADLFPALRVGHRVTGPRLDDRTNDFNGASADDAEVARLQVVENVDRTGDTEPLYGEDDCVLCCVSVDLEGTDRRSTPR